MYRAADGKAHSLAEQDSVSALYDDARALYQAIRRPGTGQISDAAQLHVSPDGRYAVYSATLVDSLEGLPATRICLTDLLNGETRVLTYGPNNDCSPKFSPDGGRIAFLSDRHEAGDLQLYLLDVRFGGARATARVPGWVEYLHWSPDGRLILLGVAGHGADVAGTQGAITTTQTSQGLPSWAPRVETGSESCRWRSAWVYDPGVDGVRRVSQSASNVWEAAWYGNDTLVAVVSPGAAEGLWYSARLHAIDLHTGGTRQVYAPRHQLGWPTVSPSGELLALVEAVCSDRWIVAGELLLVDRAGTVHRIDTHGVDITTAEWRSEHHLFVAGVRGIQTVVGLYEIATGKFTEVWNSDEISTSGSFIAAAALDETGDCVLIGEGFTRAPEIALVRNGQYSTVRSFDVGYGSCVDETIIGGLRHVRWTAPDGLPIEGLLLQPKSPGPHPVVMHVHGGPVSHWRTMWLGRPRGLPMLLLLKHGYALFLPNPRGSSGRGREFAALVVGDMGGADTFDYLAGLDHLVERALVKSTHLGVTGVSYGGYMSAWLSTQDRRFAAAVAVSPSTNRVSGYLLSNIPQFISTFLADVYTNFGGRFFQRSPVMHARRAGTPTLCICGALDRCTPPQEAMQFHNALLENGVRSVLVTYPQEGHGVRKFPAAIDYAARVVAWFEAHMPASGAGQYLDR